MDGVALAFCQGHLNAKNERGSHVKTSLEQIAAMIAQEEAFLPRFAPGTSQHSLLTNRIAALYTVQNLLTGEGVFSREELEFALPRIESIIHKVGKARDKYAPGSQNYLRFNSTVRAMEEAKSRIQQALMNTEATWLDEVKAKAKRKNEILFSKDNLLFRELNLLLPAQSRRVVTLWALELAGEGAEVFARAYPNEPRPGRAVEAARAWAVGEITMPLAKRAILDCHALAKELTDLAGIARCHAIAQGCSVVHTTGHAMGLPIYELTAIVRELGVDNCTEAVQERGQAYVEKLLYWNRHEAEYTGPWANFLR